MFPNPQDTLPLPPRPSLERYKKLAKELVKACNSAESDAIGHWSEEWVEALVKLSGLRIARGLPVHIQRWIDEVEEFAERKLLGSDPADRKCALADAQFVIARSHGFESWPKFAKQLEAQERWKELCERVVVEQDPDMFVATIQELLRVLEDRHERRHNVTVSEVAVKEKPARV